MEKKDKSVLDNIPVDDKAFPLMGPKRGTGAEKPMHIVGNCVVCGNPVYGPTSVPVGTEGTVMVRRSCNCITPEEKKTLQDTMKTK